MDTIKTRPKALIPAMVNAVLDGIKTQTRFPIQSPAKNLQASGTTCIERVKATDIEAGKWQWRMRAKTGVWWHYTHEDFISKCPSGKVGDRLWVRERARLIDTVGGACWDMRAHSKGRFRYEADGTETGWIDYPSRLAPLSQGRCVPNGCYRELSRILLEITDIRVERIQSISHADAIAEGIEREHAYDGTPDFGYDMGMWYRDYSSRALSAMIQSPIESLHTLWDSIYKAKGKGWAVNPWAWVVEFKVISTAPPCGDK